MLCLVAPGFVTVFTQDIQEESPVAHTDSNHNMTALMHAAIAGDLELVNTYIEYGWDVNAKSAFGVTVLMHASSGLQSNPAVIQTLIDHGADVNAQDDLEQNALAHALSTDMYERNNTAVIRTLVENGSDDPTMIGSMYATSHIEHIINHNILNREIHPLVKPHIQIYEYYKGEPISQDLRFGFMPYWIASKIRIGGTCLIPYSFFPKIILLNPIYWERYGHTDRESVVAHELGHCLLHRPHTTTDTLSFMSKPRPYFYKDEDREELYKELFSNKDTYFKQATRCLLGVIKNIIAISGGITSSTETWTHLSMNETPSAGSVCSNVFQF